MQTTTFHHKQGGSSSAIQNNLPAINELSRFGHSVTLRKYKG